MITDYMDRGVIKNPRINIFLSQTLSQAQFSMLSFPSLENVEGAKCEVAGKQDNLLLQTCGNLISI